MELQRFEKLEVSKELQKGEDEEKQGRVKESELLEKTGIRGTISRIHLIFL